MAKLRMAHASTHGARKPPGPKKSMKTMASFAFTEAIWPKINYHNVSLGSFPEVGEKQKM